jgi:hypothetical protein
MLMSAVFWVSLVLPLSIVFILPRTNKNLRVQLTRDPAAAVMFGVAAMLTFAFPLCAEVAARTHNFEIVKGVLLATGVFALVGIAFGITRAIKMSRAVKNRI